jgi:hypothetical protein
MEIEEVKLWQWMLAGLIAGLLFSCIVRLSGPGYDSQPRDTIEPGEFENAVYGLTKFNDLGRFARGGAFRQSQAYIEKYHKDLPRLRYLTVHLPQSSDPKHYWITGESYFVGLRPKDASKPSGTEEVFEEWKPFKYAAGIPYVPGYAEHELKKLPGSNAMESELADLKKAMGGQMSFPTVVSFLNAAAKLPPENSASANKLTFTQAWWEQPAMVWSLPPFTGFLLIGVAWPLALGILQNLGVAKPAPVKAKPKPVQPAEPLHIGSTEGVILQPVKPAPPPPPDPKSKEYTGVFYPVVKVANHEEEKPKAAAATKPPAAAAKPPAAAAKPKPAPAKAK